VVNIFKVLFFKLFSKLFFLNKYNFRSLEFKACDEKKCQNGGKCQEGSDEYDCLCPIGFTGKKCECNYNSFSKIIANRIVLNKNKN